VATAMMSHGRSGYFSFAMLMPEGGSCCCAR
jgi:hypothetical protein